MAGRIAVDGKFFADAKRRFQFRGVTYGTFSPRADGARFPEREVLKQDFAQLRDAGFTVVRTYTAPPDDLLDVAADWGLRILAGAFYPDWRYLLGGARRDLRRITRDAGAEVRRAARQLAGNEQVLGLSIGNEIPADALRWYGTDAVARTLHELVEVVREEDPDLLVTYGNYPTAEYLPLDSLDFLMFNVFLECHADFRSYLTRLQNLAGDRPLVIGELGLDAGTTPDGEQRQAEVLDWQLATVLERGVAGSCVFSWTDDWVVGEDRVEDWHFGLTDADRRARPALDVVSGWNARDVGDLPVEWPAISVVICAHNAESTIEECLQHTCELDYPELEILVVDDGSTDRTAEIARQHPRARLIELPHAGLSVARNAGYRAAGGHLVAYLDSDAYPSPEWPYFLALGAQAAGDASLAGVGGPNVPPRSDGPGAQIVARAPGGPVHVLLSDDRAEHVPGCNMAFRKEVLEELGGFDPVFTAAGDDVDLCWRVLDAGHEIGFHPAALIWHHRRSGFRTYLRQQKGYGRSEALVEARHPARFTPAGTARWRGRIYTSVVPSMTRQRVYRGRYGAAAYQSVYQGGGHLLDVAHQAGLPIAVALVPTAALAAVSPWLSIPALAGLAFLAAVFLFDVVTASPPRDWRGASFRTRLALHQLAQPLVRAWSRARQRRSALRDLPRRGELPPLLQWLPPGIAVVIEDRPRTDLASLLGDEFRRRGIEVVEASGWDDYDCRLLLSRLVVADLRTSSHPPGYVQVRLSPRLRPKMVVAAVAVATGALLISPVLAAVTAALALASGAKGLASSRLVLRRALRGATP